LIEFSIFDFRFSISEIAGRAFCASFAAALMVMYEWPEGEFLIIDVGLAKSQDTLSARALLLIKGDV
jgi:hypothetical protein